MEVRKIKYSSLGYNRVRQFASGEKVLMPEGKREIVQPLSKILTERRHRYATSTTFIFSFGLQVEVVW